MIISIAEQKPNLELFSRFWHRQFRFDICYPPKLSSILKTLRIPFSEEVCQHVLNVTECLQDGFSKKSQRYVMNVLTQVDTFKYPPSIIKLCIKYVEAIAKDFSCGNGDKVIISSVYFFQLLF